MSHSSTNIKAGILAPIPALARYLTFTLIDATQARLALHDSVDALFKFTRPITGNYYWCPPIRDGRLDLSALGL